MNQLERASIPKPERREGEQEQIGEAEKAREVAMALDALRKTVGEQIRLRDQVRNELDRELSVSQDAGLRKEGNRIIGMSRAVTERVKRYLRSAAVGVALAGEGIASFFLAHDALGCVESEGDAEQEQPLTEDNLDTIGNTISDLFDEIGDSQPPQPTRDDLTDEAIERRMRAVSIRSKEIADELLDFAREARSGQDLIEAYHTLIEGENVLEGMIMDHISRAAKQLETADPVTAKKLYELLGPDAALDFAVRQKNEDALYEQTAERLAIAVVGSQDETKNTERWEITNLAGRDDLAQVYTQMLALDERRRVALIGLLDEYIIIRERELQSFYESIQTEEDESAYNTAHVLFERLRILRDALKNNDINPNFPPLP